MCFVFDHRLQVELKMMRILVLLFLLSCLSCVEQQVGADAISYEATTELFKQDVAKFFDDIALLSESEFDGFIVKRSEHDKNSPVVYLLGEHHLDHLGQKRRLALANRLAKKGRVKILMEGLPKTATVDNRGIAKMGYVLGFFLRAKYAELNGAGSYNAGAVDSWVAGHVKKYYEIFVRAFIDNKIDERFALKNMSFAGWDMEDTRSVDYGFDYMVQRNRSLFASLDKDDVRPQVVFAGFSHLPLGDYYEYSLRHQQEPGKPNYDEFYAQLITQKGLSVGSAEELYRSLVKDNWNFIEAIPVSSLDLFKISLDKNRP